MKKVYVSEELLPILEDFFEKNEVFFKIVSEDGEFAIMDTGTQRKESSTDVLYSGGWIKCDTARSTAEKIGVPLSRMGKLLDHLKIKVKQCGLGCF